MATTTRRLLLGAATLAAIIPAAVVSFPADAAQPQQPVVGVAAQDGPLDPRCPRGRHSLQDYRVYHRKVFRRAKVSLRAHVRIAYMQKCQISAWGKRMAVRYHDRFKAEREAQQAREAAERVMAGLEGTLNAIAQCESHGDPDAISASGTYRGKYQFDLSTWASVGGSGDPAAASESEQDRRAAMLYRSGGPGRWPVCG